MYVFKTLFDACYEIFSYKINLLGFDISLLNVFAFATLAALCIFIIKHLLG